MNKRNGHDRKLIFPGAQAAGSIIDPSKPETPQCPMCTDLRSALEHARDCGSKAIGAAVLAKQAAELAQKSQLDMQAKLTKALEVLFAIAQYPPDGVEDCPDEPSSAKQARTYLDSLR